MSQKLDYLLDSDLDIKKNTIYLLGDIHKKRATRIAKLLWALGDMSEDPITLIINSTGGSVFDTLAIYDTMKAIPRVVNTICMGSCESGAVLLAAAGRRRYATPNCYFMIHDLQLEVPPQSLSSLKKDLDFDITLNSRFNTLLAENSKMTLEEINRICQTPGDHYFDSKQAIKYGIIDDLMQPCVKEK